MKKVVIYTLLLSASIVLNSCGFSAKSIEQNIRIEGVENIDIMGLTGLQVDLKVKNDMRGVIEVETGRIELFDEGEYVGSLELREAVALPKKWSGVVATRWRIDAPNVMAMLSVARQIVGKKTDDLTVNYSFKGDYGIIPLNISGEGVPLSDFLGIFEHEFGGEKID